MNSWRKAFVLMISLAAVVAASLAWYLRTYDGNRPGWPLQNIAPAAAGEELKGTDSGHSDQRRIGPRRHHHPVDFEHYQTRAADVGGNG